MKYILIFVLFLVVGCTTPTARIMTNADAEMDKAYLAGSFINSYRESYARLAVEVNEVSKGNSILIELQQPSNYQKIDIIPAEPGTYKIKKLVRLAATGGVNSTTEITHEFMGAPFKIEAGKIYYLGHFDGRSTNDITAFSVIGGAVWSSADRTHSLSLHQENIQNIKILIQKVYPNFKEYSVEQVFPLNKSSNSDAFGAGS